MNDAHTQTNLTCTGCGYLLDGLNLRDNCPECGKRIINACSWCQYDVSSTAPDANCPECGVPVSASIGYGVLAAAPIKILHSIHKGFRLVTVLILIYIISAITTGLVGAGVVVLNNSVIHWFTIGSSLINNSLLLGIIYGWWILSTPVPDLPPRTDAKDRRSLLRISLLLFAITVVLSMPLVFFIPNYANPNLTATAPILIMWFLSIASTVLMVLVYIGNVRYIGWFAKIVRNRKMERRAKHLIWSGPLIFIIGFIFLFIGPLIVLILYWNMIEYTRRDLKKIINAAERNRFDGA